ncbi:hypothetical protein XarbCFBP6827_09120 [Xanthomonas arboricola]|nr:hypothetical protein XarjCFBP1022_16190 [Xanthomonas arboricola]PPU51740.1 hypothetical protein XarbCFBP6827_09120 [Xanthomonas arboricola]
MASEDAQAGADPSLRLRLQCSSAASARNAGDSAAGLLACGSLHRAGHPVIAKGCSGSKESARQTQHRHTGWHALQRR